MVRRTTLLNSPRLPKSLGRKQSGPLVLEQAAPLMIPSCTNVSIAW